MAHFLYQTALAEAHTKIMELCVHACNYYKIHTQA